MVGKGTPSFGRKHKLNHIKCRRCGRHSYNVNKSSCAACGYGRTAKLRTYSWQWKTIERSGRRK